MDGHVLVHRHVHQDQSLVAAKRTPVRDNHIPTSKGEKGRSVEQPWSAMMSDYSFSRMISNVNKA